MIANPNRRPVERLIPWCWLWLGLPEFIGLLWSLLHGDSLLTGLIIALVLRQSWVAAEVIHGAGHTLARALVDQDVGAIQMGNLLEHRCPWQMLRSLLPLAPLAPIVLSPLEQRQQPWLAAGDPEPWKVRLKAGGPMLLHLIAILGSWLAICCLPVSAGWADPWVHGLLTGLMATNLWLLVTSRTDHQTILSGRGAVLCCGNFGLLTAPETPDRGELLTANAIRIFHLMGRDTELRGAQAGGALVMALDRHGDHGFVGHKIVNAKRGDLTPSLEAGFRRRRRRARHRGWRPHPSGLLACWHYRFGTSGPPAVRETHWQEWTPGRRCQLWGLGADGRWSKAWRRVHHRITHNGDFEAFEAFGREVAVGSDLGPWLEHALHRPAPAVVDSARIAGMMDLMICKGDWYASVRWAFLQILAVFPATPAAEDLDRWASCFESIFVASAMSRRGHVTRPVGHPWGDWLKDQMTESTLAELRAEPRLGTFDSSQLRSWVHLAIELFLSNDPAEAMRQFMERARGSFGLVVASTIWPERLVLSSLGQPITIGMAPSDGLVLYASETAAVDSVLNGNNMAWRIDLDDNSGEIAVLSNSDLRVISLTLGRPLTADELLQRRRPYGGVGDRPIPSSGQSTRSDQWDPVASDIVEIPALLASIYSDWSNPGSANRQAADYLAQLLIAKAANLYSKEALLRRSGLNESLAKSSDVDLLLTGVENSLWLAERFASDLSDLMPRLSVRVLSANAVLKALQNDISKLGLARQSIVLVLSHSSRTFPSRQVMEACDLMVRMDVIREFFILTGEPDSLQGSPMLQVDSAGQARGQRLFTTGAGRRRAEPATASVAAMHQTLTQLLFRLGRQLLQAFPSDQDPPLGMELSQQQLMRLESSETDALIRESREIIGVDSRGQAQPTATSRRLQRAGRRWALHVLETPTAWIIHAIYILLSLELGLPLVQSLAHQLVGDRIWAGSSAASGILRGAALGADVCVYIFGPWLWTLALRMLQKRQMLARTGRRTLVVGEARWITPLLTNYISKLFALSYGIASVDVQGGDVGDHLLHTHAHRLVRGTLLFLGVPDGRCGGLKRAEADAALLTARQSDGIRHWDTGPEILAVSTDPSVVVGPFRQALVLPCSTELADGTGDLNRPDDQLLENLRESRFGAFRRLLASYVFFWAMARQVGLVPVLQFKWWRSQSRTRVMTTAAPVSAARLDLVESREVDALDLEKVAGREQS